VKPGDRPSRHFLVKLNFSPAQAEDTIWKEGRIGEGRRKRSRKERTNPGSKHIGTL
jgi:hypothetical protein